MARDFREGLCEKLSRVASGGSDGPGDVLAQPTRARLFAHLARLGHPAGTNELAAELGLHPSGVRVHLERLRSAGLIARERRASAARAPARQLVDRARRPARRPAPRRLPAAGALAGPAAFRDAQDGCGRWSAPGRELGRELPSTRGPGPPEERMGRTLTALGFAPQREPAAGTRCVSAR